MMEWRNRSDVSGKSPLEGRNSLRPHLAATDCHPTKIRLPHIPLYSDDAGKIPSALSITITITITIRNNPTRT